MHPIGFVRVVRTVVVAACVAGCFGKIAPVEGEDVYLRAGRLPDAGTERAPGRCGDALARASFTFDASDEGWSHGALDENASDGAGHGADPWKRGAATVGTACASGACFGTELTANYRECQAAHLVSPALDLSTCAGRDLALVFDHAYSFATGGVPGADWYDGGFVEASADGEHWTVLPADYSGALAPRENDGATTCGLPTSLGGEPAYVGEQLTTTTTRIALPPELVSASTRIRFTMASGRARVETGAYGATDFLPTSYWGWRIDDVRLEAR